jgi:acetyl-CoA acetyltransferase
MNKQRRKQLNALQDALQNTGLRAAFDNLETIKNELETLRDEEEAAYDAMPESLQTDDAVYPLTQINEALSKIEALIDEFDFTELDEAFDAIENAKGMED